MSPRRKSSACLRPLVAEDEPVVRETVVRILKERFDERLDAAPVEVDSVEKLYQLLRDFELRINLIFCDKTLNGGEADLSEIMSYLEHQRGRSVLFVMTGDTVDAPPSSDKIRVSLFLKPFTPEELRMAIAAAIEFIVKGRMVDVVTSSMPVLAVDDTSTLSEIQGYQSLSVLMRALSSDYVFLTLSEAESAHVSSLVEDAFMVLQESLDEGPDAFRSMFFTYFPSDRREVLVQLLGELPDHRAAGILLRGHLHDITNILAAYAAPQGMAWEEASPELRDIVDTVYDIFSGYNAGHERDFSRHQSVSDVLDFFGDRFKIEGREELPEDLMVYAPSGMLKSILRTFYTNALKLSENFHLLLRAKVENNQLVFCIFDDLQHFSPDQLNCLFDASVESRGRYATGGTGLWRLAELIEVINGGASITSFHQIHAETQDGWLEKAPREQVKTVEQPLDFPAGMSKCFQVRLPLKRAIVA